MALAPNITSNGVGIAFGFDQADANYLAIHIRLNLESFEKQRQRMKTIWLLQPSFSSRLNTRQDSFCFKTRAGAVGILQILNPEESPRGVRVRYKLVQNVQDAAALQKRLRVERMNEMRLLIMAIIMYRDQHDNQWPAALTQTSDYLKGELTAKTNDYVYKQPETNQAMSAMATAEVLFEKTPISPDGQCVGFADGHVEFKRRLAQGSATSTAPQTSPPTSKPASARLKKLWRSRTGMNCSPPSPLMPRAPEISRRRAPPSGR